MGVLVGDQEHLTCLTLNQRGILLQRLICPLKIVFQIDEETVDETSLLNLVEYLGKCKLVWILLIVIVILLRACLSSVVLDPLGARWLVLSRLLKAAYVLDHLAEEVQDWKGWCLCPLDLLW